jgi:glycosyltransferase involved in cell wall biosynthesis
MTQRMHALGAGEVMTFPFGLEALPPTPAAKDPNLFFANRGLEAIYDPLRVVATFAEIAQSWPDARLVVAHDGALREAMQAAVAQQGLAERVQFVGRLSAADQAQRYTQAQWYISLPRSDSVSVSALEALGHGCIPILSDLPANRELVRDGDNGCIVPPDGSGLLSRLGDLARRAPEIAQANHDWVAQHALFAPSVQGFLQRLAVA